MVYSNRKQLQKERLTDFINIEWLPSKCKLLGNLKALSFNVPRLFTGILLKKTGGCLNPRASGDITRKLPLFLA